MLRGWFSVQLIIVVLICALPELRSGIINLFPDPHGSVKYGLEAYHGLLLRLPDLPVLIVSCLLLTVWLRHRRQWLWSTAGLLILGQLLPHFNRFTLCGWILWLALNAQPRGLPPRTRVLLWIPGSWLLCPALLVQRCKMNQGTFILAIVLTMSTPVWVLIDGLTGYTRLQTALEQWPESRLDPDIKQLARSPVGVRADWHGVRILNGYAIVACERIPRISAFPLLGGPAQDFALRPRDERAGFFPPIDIAVSASQNWVWALDGGRDLVRLSLVDGKWQPPMRQKLPRPMQFSTFNQSEQELLVTSVQVAGPFPRQTLRISKADPSNIKILTLHTIDGELPMPREALWVPPLKRLLLAPDFGTHLYSVDIDTGRAEKWLAAPTMNGKMLWLPKGKRVLLALPNRPELWLIDPLSPKNITRLSTQLGVRAVAVDEDNELVITASVLTGELWVQSLRDGAVLKRSGRVMPMVRELALDPQLGVAVLTSWAAVYQFDYLNGVIKH